MVNSAINFLISGVEAMKKYLDHDSRGIGVSGPNDIKYIQIPTPAWYPDSFMRSIKNSAYLKMINNSSYLNRNENENRTKLEFYEEKTGGNIVMNALQGAVKSLVSTGVNQVMSVANKAQGIYDSVASLFSKNETKDPTLAQTIVENQQIPFLAAQPYIEVRGIHLTEGIRASCEILQSALKMTNSAWGVVKDVVTLDFSAAANALMSGNKAVIKAVSKTFFSAETVNNIGASKKIADYPNDWSQLLELIFGNDLRLHGVAEQLIRQSIVGRYTMSCKIPYINNKNANLIQSTGQGNFKNGAFGYEKTGEKAKDTVEKLAQSATEDLNLGLSDMIKWIYNPKGDDSYTVSPVDTTFTIYNDTMEHFLVNYAFVFSFMATTKATTDGILVRAPYVYDIIIPGGVRYMLCKCEASVKNVGKMRCLSADTDQIAKLFNKSMGVPINANSIKYIPDAYEVHIKFTSLLPDLWNFIESYINMNTQSEKDIAIGTEISSTLATFAKTLTDKPPAEGEKKTETNKG